MTCCPIQSAPAGSAFHGGSLLCLGYAGTGSPVGSLLALQRSLNLAMQSLQEGHASEVSDLKLNEYSQGIAHVIGLE